MKCYLIRHGQTEGNIYMHFNGSGTDEPLTQEGRAALKEIEDVPQNAAIFSSPLIRAVQTAAILFPDRDVEIIEDIREMHFGRFEGKNHEDLKDDPDYKAWLESRGAMKIPGGESMAELAVRTKAAIAEAYAAAVDSDAECMYIVTHGCAIMSLMYQLTGEDYLGFNPPNGAGYELELTADPEGGSIAAASYSRFTGALADGSVDWKTPQYTPPDQIRQ